MGKRKNPGSLRIGLPILAVGLISVSAFGQGTIPNPLLVLQDSASDGATLPLFSVVGGSGSSTQGIQVTSQTTGSGGPLTIFQPTGHGGLTLLQTGAATSSNGVDSPQFSTCAQQWTGSGTSTPQCWIFQVKGGGNATTMLPNQPDTLLLSRTPTNSTTNITLQVPQALNFAAGDSTHGGQLTIGSVPSNAADLTTRPVTLVGGFTNNTGGMAGNLQLFPGFLNTTSTFTGAPLEGNLQIGMAVQGVFHNVMTQTLLACYSTTAQTAQLCPDLTSPLLGVFLPGFACTAGGTCSSGNSTAVMTPPSRALVLATSSHTWVAGTPVCRDPSAGNSAFAAISTTGACPIGQAVGVAVGDTGSQHLVDLDFAPQGTTSSGNATTYATAGSSLSSTTPAGTLLAADGSGNVSGSGISDGFTTPPYVPQVVSVYNAPGSTGSILSTPIASSATGQYSISVYINLTTACTTAGAGSLTPSVTYTDSSNVSFTRTLASIPALAIATLPANNNSTVNFWSVSSPGTISIAVSYAPCSMGTPTYDVHFVLTKLQ